MELIKNYKFIIGAGLYALSAMLFVWALRFGDLSVLYPIIATSYIWVAVFSILFLKESFHPLGWFGIGLIIAGISLIVK
jgi:undecaprenyl phosphate-alpha-L-ara4N flippase subunit ArnE